MKIIDVFRSKGYTVSTFVSKPEAFDYLFNAVKGKKVGIGDSQTLLDLGLYEALKGKTEVYFPGDCATNEEFIEIAKKTLGTEVFLTSANAVAETGEIVNIDSTGNRIAASLFGHEKVYFVIGINKIVPTLDEAIWRARNIAAPLNAKRLGFKTPCAIKADKCYDCKSPMRICNAMTIHLSKIDDMEVEIVIIDENLGY